MTSRRTGLVLLAAVSTGFAWLAVPAASGETLAGERATLMVDLDPYVLAERADQQVEVIAERSETDTVFANPDGTTTREISAVPVRAFDGDVWLDVDTDLAVAADGSIQPKVLTDRVVLSAGGSEPLIVSEVDGIETRLSWPDALPEPTLDGNVATYPDVFTGVDLRVAVTDIGTSTVLVVEDEAAASQPELAEIELPYEVIGGKLEMVESGAVVILDEFDREVAAAGTPVMWDSSGQVFDEAGGTLADESDEALGERTLGPAEGDQIDEIATTIGADTITLAPPTAALVGEHVEYPVFVDPTVSRTPTARAMVTRAFPNTSFHNWSGASEGVGYQNYESPFTTKRLMWRFNTTAFAGATISSAQFSAARSHSATCQGSRLRVFELLHFSTGTTWNNQPDWVSARFQDEVVDAAGRAGCSPGAKRLEWNVTKGVRRAVNVDKGHVNLGLKTFSESTPGHWRRFRPDARLSVTYSFPPNRPTGMRHVSPNRTCNSSQPMGPDTPRLQVTLRDRNPGEQVRPHFQLFRGTSTSGQKLWDQQGHYVPPGTTYLTLTTNRLGIPHVAGRPQGGTYTWRVRAIDNSRAGSGGANLVSPWSATCTFTIDPDAPLEPEITPAHDGPWIFGDASTSRSFLLEPNENEDDPDAHVYRWSVNNTEPTHQVSANSTTRRATISSVAAGQVGRNVLRVWAEDHAGNRSVPAEYAFDAIWTGTTDSVRYRFDLPSGDDPPNLAPSVGAITGPGLDLFLADGQWSRRGEYLDGTSVIDDYAASFHAGDLYARTISQRAVRTDDSFMVSAWLDPALTGDDMYAVSQQATGGTAFRLGVESCATEGGWCFAFGVYDTATDSYATAHLPMTVYDEFDVRPQFTHVVGMFDAADGTVSLWMPDPGGGTEHWISETAVVNGETLASAATHALLVGATGPMPSGAHRWRGRIDDVRLAQGGTDQGTLEQITVSEEKPYNECWGTECGS